MAASWLAAPSPGHACGYVVGLYIAEPTDGATGVPTNVVPWLYGQLGGTMPQSGIPGSSEVTGEVWIALLDDTGATVDVDLVTLLNDWRPRHDSVEVRPRAALAPMTRYTLRVQGSDGVVMHTFTAGEGPLGAEPDGLGELAMQVADNAYMSSCGDNAFACVEYARETTVHATVRHAGAITTEHLWLWPRSFRYYQEESSSDAPFCIELRARNLGGQLGPPSEICSDGAPTFAIATTSPVQCDGARITVSGAHVDDGSGAPDPVDAGIGMEPAPAAGGGGCSAGGRAAGSTGGCVIVLLFVLSGLGRARGGAWAR